MNMKTNRRAALKKLGTGACITALAFRPRRLRAATTEKLRVGVMGLNRGMAHVDTFAEIDGVEIAYVCDVDQRRLASAVKRAGERQRSDPQGVRDFRRILDDPTVDALSIAAPNFWHAPATILACAAGKHVYVEKPGSHNPHEAEMIVAAARKFDRRVQLGVQRRSAAHYIEAIQRVREGEIGTVRFARCWYDNARGSIGRGQRVAVPDWLNYELWQGPVPESPYVDNLVHYNWHWRWKWGNGELGNNGVHALDIARWGLQVDRPRSASYTGGRYHFDDDQESPDTGLAVFDFGHCGISWDQSSCVPRRPEQLGFVTFYGDGGTLAAHDRGFAIYDEKGTEIKRSSGGYNNLRHFQNFVDAIRDDQPLNADIGECQPSAMLCHYGNIGYRVNRVVRVDSTSGRVLDDPHAMTMWQRSYRKGWEPHL